VDGDDPPEPLTCADWVMGIADFAQGATGVNGNLLEATRTSPVVTHEADDSVTQIRNTTQIERDGAIIFFGEWFLADDETWLLGQYSACTDFIPEESGSIQ